MTFRFQVTFKRGVETVATIEGQRILNTDDITVKEIGEDVLHAEAFLEKLTGYRVHIEQIN